MVVVRHTGMDAGIQAMDGNLMISKCPALGIAVTLPCRPCTSLDSGILTGMTVFSCTTRFLYNEKNKLRTAEENMITIELPESIERQFTELATRTGMTLQSCVQKAILNYLEDLEDLADAEEIMKDHKPEDAISLDEVVKEYGSETKLSPF